MTGMPERPPVFESIGASGALGALARRRLDGWARSATADAAPLLGKCGIVAVNVVGSAAAGLLLAWSASPAAHVASTGFLGGFTTFSTALVDAVDLWRGGRRASAVVLAVGTWAASVAAAAAAVWAASPGAPGV